MCKAKLISKQPYSGQYGSGIEFTFQAEFGEYKSKKKDSDLSGERYGFLKTLPIGSLVDLKKNDKGQGYFINQVKEQTTEEIFNELTGATPAANDFESKVKHALSEWLIIEKEVKPKLLQMGYSLEDVRTVVTTLRIQIK